MWLDDVICLQRWGYRTCQNSASAAEINRRQSSRRLNSTRTLYELVQSVLMSTAAVVDVLLAASSSADDGVAGWADMVRCCLQQLAAANKDKNRNIFTPPFLLFSSPTTFRHAEGLHHWISSKRPRFEQR